MTTATDGERSGRSNGLVVGIVVAILALVVLCLLIVHRGANRIHQAKESGTMQACRTIALAEFQYANDNDGHYPTGGSSTEVFQKLIDGNYLSDPNIFFIPMPGKTAPMSNHLLPDNVCYDVTSDIDLSSPDEVPVVFVTGFRIEYKPGGSATSRVKPFPGYYEERRGMLGLTSRSWQTTEGVPVSYHSNNAFFRISRIPGTSSTDIGPDGFGRVSNFVSPDFNSHGKTYRQLTPDGILK